MSRSTFVTRCINQYLGGAFALYLAFDTGNGFDIDLDLISKRRVRWVAIIFEWSTVQHKAWKTALCEVLCRAIKR